MSVCAMLVGKSFVKLFKIVQTLGQVISAVASATRTWINRQTMAKLVRPYQMHFSTGLSGRAYLVLRGWYESNSWEQSPPAFTKIMLPPGW
jgi:hypothetical protein